MSKATTEDRMKVVPGWIHLVFSVILLFAFLIRVSWIGAGEFRYDDVALALLSQRQASGEFQLFGMQSSNGGLNFPAAVYFLAGLFTISPDYYGVMVLIVSFNILGLWLLWLLARRLFDARVALMAVYLMAVSVWAIQFSRRLWAQEFNGPFLIAGFLLAIWGFVDGRRWAQLLALPVLLFGMQIHFAAFALFPAFIFVVWRGRKNIDLRLVTGSLLLSALFTAPFIYGIVTDRTDAPNILERFAEQAATTADKLGETTTEYPFQHLFNIIGGTGLDVYYAFPAEVLSASPYVLVSAVLLWIGVLVGLVAAWQNHRWKVILFLIWILFPALVIATGVVGALMFYYLMLLPPMVVIAAFGLVTLVQRLPRMASGMVTAMLLVAVGAIQVVYINQFFERVMNVSGFAISTPIGFLLNARAELPPPRDLIMIGTRYLISEGDIWSVFLYRRTECVRELAMEGGVSLVVMPAQPYTVMYSADSELNPLYVNDAPTEIPLRVGDEPYRYYQFDVPPQPAVLEEIISVPEMTFANALMLQGYHLSGAQMTLDYSVINIGARDDFKFFVHFLDGAGAQIGQFDASFYPGIHWCQGDRYLLSFQIPLTPRELTEVTTLRIGMYQQRRNTLMGVDAFSRQGERFPWVDVSLERP